MLPLIGVFIYMLLRPPEYIADVRERELEIRAMERNLGKQERCPHCMSHIESDYLVCPICVTKLRESCRRCDKPLDPRWKLCPFCETEVPAGGASPTPSRPYDIQSQAEQSGSVGKRPSRPARLTRSREAARVTRKDTTMQSPSVARDKGSRKPPAVRDPSSGKSSGGDDSTPPSPKKPDSDDSTSSPIDPSTLLMKMPPAPAGAGVSSESDR